LGQTEILDKALKTKQLSTKDNILDFFLSGDNVAPRFNQEIMPFKEEAIQLVSVPPQMILNVPDFPFIFPASSKLPGISLVCVD